MLSIYTVLLILSTVLSDPLNSTNFRKDYTYFKSFDSFYKLHSGFQSWSDAILICRAENAELFIPDTKEEYEEITNYTKLKEFWIGAHDKFYEGDYVTLSGDPLDLKYVNWKKDLQKNSDNKGRCIMIDKDFYVNTPCGKKQRFICKKDASNISYDSICDSYSPGYIKSSIGNCYKFHTQPSTWFQAYRICKAEEATLVIINNKEESQFLMREFSNYPEFSLPGNFYKKVIHVNFSNLLAQGQYQTTQGKLLSEVGYENWAQNQPDGYSTYSYSDKCGSMNRDGTLSEVSCVTKAMFVCEKKLNSSTNQYQVNQLIK